MILISTLTNYVDIIAKVSDPKIYITDFEIHFLFNFTFVVKILAYRQRIKIYYNEFLQTRIYL